MSTLNALNTLIGIVNSRKNKLNPTGPMPSAAASSDPNQTNPTLPVDPATSPTATSSANANPPSNPSPSDPDGSQNPAVAQPTDGPSPSPMPAAQNGPQTEDSLRQQLQQSDVYDLSGEKAAAEALKRDEAFKQQSIEQKAQETKDFFAEQDRKQQETYQDIQKQAGQQLQEQQEKEFWDQKKSQEMQAGMDKELESLHQAAKQEHQEWRSDFTQGVCRDDVAALYNKDITERVGQYKERLDDLGTNPVDAVQTIDKYKVKLQDEAAPQIEQKTAELHQEQFPEYQDVAQKGPSGPVEGPSKGFGPFEGTKPGDFWPGPQSKPGDFWPGGGDKYPLPNEEFFKPLTKDNNPIDRSGEPVATQGEIIPPEKPGAAPKPEPLTIDGVATHVPEMEALPKPTEPAGLLPPPEKMTPLPQQAAQASTAPGADGSTAIPPASPVPPMSEIPPASPVPPMSEIPPASPIPSASPIPPASPITPAPGGGGNGGGGGSGDSAKGSGDNSSADDSAYYAARLRQQADDAATRKGEEEWEASVHSTTEKVELAEHVADHFGGEAVAWAAEHLPHAAEQLANSVPEHVGLGGAIPGGVWEGPVATAKFMYEAGPVGIKAGVQNEINKVKDAIDDAKDSVQQGWQATKEAAAAFSDKAQGLATTVKDNLTISSSEKIEQMVQDSNKGGESADNKMLEEIRTADKNPSLGDSKFLAGTGDAQPAPAEKGFDQSQFARDIDKSKFITPAMNANLSTLYAERWKDLHPESSAAETSKVVNDFSAKAQQIDQQTTAAAPQARRPRRRSRRLGLTIYQPPGVAATRGLWAGSSVWRQRKRALGRCRR